MTSTQQTEQMGASGTAVRRNVPTVFLVVATVVLCAGISIAAYMHSRTIATIDKLFVSGRVDGYETAIAAKIPGLITFISNREGESVKAGQILVQLEASDVKAQLKQAVAQAEGARDSAAALQEQENTIKHQIEEAQTARTQSEEESSGNILQAQFNVEALKKEEEGARAALSVAQAHYKMAKLTTQRYRYLADSGAISQERADQASTEAEAFRQTVINRQEELDSIEQKIAAATAATKVAKASRLTPEQRQKKVLQLMSQLKQLQKQEAAANAQARQADAKQEELNATLSYLTVRSPIDGVVIARSAEPGAVVGVGQTVLTIIDPKTVFLRGFVPDSQIGLVRLGQKAEIILDSSPKKPISAHVSEVDAQASFTPENIYFKKDRVKQVFGIKLAIDDPDGFAKLGMPADANIFLNSNGE